MASCPKCTPSSPAPQPPEYQPDSISACPSLRPEDVLLRHTFTYRFEDPGEVAALEVVGRMLADYLNETAQMGDPSIEGMLAAKLNAVADDLDEIGAYLTMVSCERHEANLDFREERYSFEAEGWAKTAFKLAKSIREEVTH